MKKPIEVYTVDEDDVEGVMCEECAENRDESDW